MTRALAVLVLATVLAGCAETEGLTIDEPIAIAPGRADYVPGESAIYCYRTLADADCFREPQPGPPNRLINAYSDRTEG